MIKRLLLGLGAVVTILAATMVLALWPQPESRVYPMSLAAARQILGRTQPPAAVMNSSFDDATTEAREPQRVAWVFRRERNELLRITLDLSPEGSDAVRVKIGISAPKSGANGDVAARLDDNPLMMRFFAAAAHEQVASALESRDFNPFAIGPQVAALMIANLGTIAKLPAQVDQVHADGLKAERDAFAKAYADEAAGRRR
ncbi:MAG: hypothetical protein U1E56_00410 [Bauldia sp.]